VRLERKLGLGFYFLANKCDAFCLFFACSTIMLYLLCPVYFDARQREGEARARQAKASDLCMSCHVRVCTYVRAYGRKAKDQAFIFFSWGKGQLAG